MRVKKESCEALQEAVKDANRKVSELAKKAQEANRSAQKFVEKSNKSTEQIAKQWALLGGRFSMENIAVPLIRRGIIFLEKLNLINTEVEETEETRQIHNRLSRLVRDRHAALEELNKIRQELEESEINLQSKEKAWSQCISRRNDV